jgi:hypothetical protein
MLLDYAKERILDDTEELINYAVVNILKEQIARKEAEEAEATEAEEKPEPPEED